MICHQSGRNLSCDTLDFRNFNIRMISAYLWFLTISLCIYYRKWQLGFWHIGFPKFKLPHNICIFLILDNFPLDLLQKIGANIRLKYCSVCLGSPMYRSVCLGSPRYRSVCISSPRYRSVRISNPRYRGVCQLPFSVIKPKGRARHAT